MQFKATALLAIVAIGSSPVVATPMPIDLALPRPSEQKPGQPIRNGLKKVGDVITIGATSCAIGTYLCVQLLTEAWKDAQSKDASSKGKPAKEDKPAKDDKPAKAGKPATGKRDVPVIGDIEARSPEPEADYIHVVTRDTTEEDAEETAEETADEEADEEADE